MCFSGMTDRPKIKLQPTQYGKTNYIAKSNSNITHSSIRKEIHIICFVCSFFQFESVKFNGQIANWAG